MLLAIDIGNTNVTCGLFHGEELRGTKRFEVEQLERPEQLAKQVQAQLAEQGLEQAQVQAAIVASVVPSATQGVVEAIFLATGISARVVGEMLPTGIDVSCEPPAAVGIDRLVNAAAATTLNKQAGCLDGAIIVDLGTATTIDCVSPEGTFLGGVIAPGIASSQQGLVAAAAQLETVPLQAPPCTVGKSTCHAMQSGLVFGHACMIDGLVSRMQKEVLCRGKVYATGGLSSLIAQHARCIDQLEPHLTLYGLQTIADYNGLRSSG